MIDAGIITGCFTLGGVAIGSISTWFISVRNAKLESQRHIRELGLQLALTHFEHRWKEAEAIAEATKTDMRVQPFSMFVIEGMKMAEIVSDTKLTPYEIGQRLAGLPTFTKTVQRGIDANK
jgi:hypothetical protein